MTPGKRREVTANINAVLTGAQSVQEILSKGRGSAARKRAQEPEQQPIAIRSIRNDLSDSLTLLEFAGPDERGAFYRICEALSRLGWDIRSARASSWQGEARSGFYVAGARHLSESEVRSALARVFAAA